MYIVTYFTGTFQICEIYRYCSHPQQFVLQAENNLEDRVTI